MPAEGVDDIGHVVPAVVGLGDERPDAGVGRHLVDLPEHLLDPVAVGGGAVLGLQPMGWRNPPCPSPSSPSLQPPRP